MNDTPDATSRPMHGGYPDATSRPMHGGYPDAEALALKFHETYERFAPSFGYETRPDTKAFDPSTPNGRLMIAVCAQLAAEVPAMQPFKTLAETPGDVPYLFPHDVAKVYHDAYRALAAQSGDLSIGEWSDINPDLHAQMTANVEEALAMAIPVVVGLPDANQLERVSDHLFLAIVGALKPFVVATS